MNPLVSVIVPVYNVESYLERCIRSIIAQKYKNLEIILIDDGSTDSSGKMCDEWGQHDTRIKVIHKENGGLSTARNLGIEVARGGYLSFVDSDDWIESNMISDLYDALTKYNVKMSVCGYWREHEGDDVSKSFCINKEKLISPEEFFLSVFRGVNIGSYAWNKLYSKELFSAVRYPIGQKYEDINTTYKVVCQCEMIAIIPTCCYHYIYREGSITSDISNIKDQILAIEERDNYLLTIYPDMRKKIYQNLNDFYVRTWFQIIKKSNDYDEIYLKQLRRYLVVNIKYGFYRKKLWLIGLPIVFAPGVFKKIIRLKNN